MINADFPAVCLTQFYKKKSGVVVFQQSSRGENMILEILASHEMEQVGSLSPRNKGRLNSRLDFVTSQ